MSKILRPVWLLTAALFLSGCRQNSAIAPAAAIQPTPDLIWLTDVTDSAGIRFTATNARSAEKRLVETMGSGCAFLDFDNDGFQDILLLNGRGLDGPQPGPAPTQKLYRNRGDGTFEDVTQKAGLGVTFYAMGCAVGDYDNDGYEDIYITGVLDSSRLFRNTGKGTFEDVTDRAGVANTGRWGTSCAWTDVDRDGWLDLFVCNYVAYRTLADDIPCFINVNQRTYCLPGVFKPSRNVLYRNNGNGSFTDISRQAGIESAEGKALGVAVWDFNHDGLPDIFVANDTTPGFLFQNRGGGRFEEIGAQSGVAYDEQGRPHSGMGIDVADVANDGSSWVTITNYSGQQVSLYRQTGPGLYQDVRLASGVGEPSSNYLGFGAGFLDLDNDTRLDLLVINGHVQDDIEIRQPNVKYAEEPLLYRNVGSGRFQEVGRMSGAPLRKPIVGRGLAWGDFDNDGALDALVTTSGGPAYLWRNETPEAGNWIKLRLLGRNSNRSAIGAVVKAAAGSAIQTAMVRSGSSYLSASDLRVHFGLGTNRSADLEVSWPSGIVDRIAGLQAGRIYTLVEGAGEAR